MGDNYIIYLTLGDNYIIYLTLGENGVIHLILHLWYLQAFLIFIVLNRDLF